MKSTLEAPKRAETPPPAIDEVEILELNSDQVVVEPGFDPERWAEWAAADRVPTRKIDSSSSALRAIERIALRPGDEIRIEGTPDGGETAALDYVEIQ